MELVEKRILKEGIVADSEILKVGSFLNQLLDVNFLIEVGKEFRRLYKDAGVTKILTVESSGIAIACLAAQFFGVPVLYAKKHASSNIAGDVYTAASHSFTHNCENTLTVAKQYLSENDTVLIIDDFLATGNAAFGLIDIVGQAGAKLAGCGIVIEKAFQGGGDTLRKRGIRVESLARIESMSVEDGVKFCR